MIQITPPSHIISVLRRLTENGFDAFVVGGGVRDSLMGRTAHDWDVATSAGTGDVGRLFEKTVMTGARFGTVTVILPECGVEVTTFRADGEYRDARRPESVAFVGGLDEDLSRRDFTMNAIAISEHGEITDPFGGIDDIQNRIIRCVGDPEQRFREDALRMLRALRFSAELGFMIEPQTMAAIRKLAPETARLSAERVCSEVERTLMSDNPEVLGKMLTTGLLTGRVLDSENPSLLERSPSLLEGLKKLPVDRSIRFCAFCTVLKASGRIGSVGDFTRGALRLDGKTVKHCSAGTALAMSGFPKCTADIKRLLAVHGTETVRAAAAGSEALHGGDTLALTDDIINGGECFSVDCLAVSGRDLLDAGFCTGKALGDTLNLLLQHVIEYPVDNKRDILLKIAGIAR